MSFQQAARGMVAMGSFRDEPGASSKLLFKTEASQHGNSIAIMKWNHRGTLVASCGSNKIVHVTDRYGKAVHDIPLQAGLCCGMDWDKDGDSLAIMQAGSPIIVLWDANSKSVSEVDTSQKEASAIAWSKTAPLLAVGSVKGHLTIYNKFEKSSIPIMSKHAKKITSAVWSSSGQLAMGGEDKQITLSKENGDGIHAIATRGDLAQPEFASHKVNGVRQPNATLSFCMSKKAIILCDTDPSHGSATPVELSFQTRYGDIVKYGWFGNEYICASFSGGFFVIVGTHNEERGEERYSKQLITDSGIVDMAICKSMQRAAVAGSSTIKFVDLADMHDIPSETISIPGVSRAQTIEWSMDGSVLSVACKGGEVFHYLVKVPVLHAVWGSNIATLASLREICIADAGKIDQPLLQFTLGMEPSLVGMGPLHIAVAQNSVVHIHSLKKRGGQLGAPKEYVGSLQALALNKTRIAALVDSRVTVERIDGEGEAMVYPERGDKSVTSMCIADEFLIFSDLKGALSIVYLPTQALITDFRHSCGITYICCNRSGSRVLFIDETGEGFIFTPVDDSAHPIPDWPHGSRTAIWDAHDDDTLVVCDKDQCHTFAFHSSTVDGAIVKKVGHSTKKPSGFEPIFLNHSQLVCQTRGGSLTRVKLNSHSLLDGEVTSGDRDRLLLRMRQAINLGRIQLAWQIALVLNSKEQFKEVADGALLHMDIETARMALRAYGDVGMVLSLERLLHEEDRNLLAGHVHIMNGNADSAEELFMASSRPIEALEMRRDLLQWDKAMALAEKLAPQEIPSICLQSGQQAEFRGDHRTALNMYSRALDGGLRGTEKDSCMAGVAKAHMRLGNLSQGLRIAQSSGSKSLARQCAEILENMKQLAEAALLYEQAGLLEKAVKIHLQGRNYSEAQRMMSKVESPSLHAMFAKAMESQHKYREALASFQRAGDMEAQVRLYLEHLNNPTEALALVRANRLTSCATQAAKYCEQHGDYRATVEFLVMAGKVDQATGIAEKRGVMDALAQAVGDGGSDEVNLKIADQYDRAGQYIEAAMFYKKCKRLDRAMDLYMKAGDEGLELSVQLAAEANNSALSRKLLTHLQGEGKDQIPKDPKYIYKLHLMLKDYTRAAGTCLSLATGMMESGQYMAARNILRDAVVDLRQAGTVPPPAIQRLLTLLHSYIIVKPSVKRGDHVNGAQMLVRCAQSISTFESHIVPILTSTVLECYRAKMRKTAFEYASMLMRPEYRPKIAEAFKKKVEQVVRKRDNSELEQSASPCPMCGHPVFDTQLQCPSCNSSLPFCIVSGYHIVGSDCTQCPGCKFPARLSLMQQLQANGENCPMCSINLKPVHLPQVNAADLVKAESASQAASDATAEEEQKQAAADDFGFA